MMYNDVFSKQINLFGSSWRVGVGYDFDFEKEGIYLNPNPHPDPNGKYANTTNAMYSGTPYPFGLDPMWQFGINKIQFTNTMKMKFSIIIGIMQMVFGLVLGLLNHIYFRRKISILLEFLPQIIFIVLIFVYLCLMIFIKWIKYSGTDDPLTGVCGPNLLIGLINMFFFKNSALRDDGTIDECQVLFPHQTDVQTFCVLVAVMCIPVMLFGKPIYLYIENKKKTKNGSKRFNNSIINQTFTDDDIESVYTRSLSSGQIVGEANIIINEEQEDEVEFELGEIFVEQTIHTIEYFLGCISHTASYLRLWALSLAHAELSEVLWTMTLKTAIGVKNPFIGPIMMYFVFPFWAGTTVGILIMMEGLSAFLHALRLHWVEFQSKFYRGEGEEFTPFSFEKILAKEDDF